MSLTDHFDAMKAQSAEAEPQGGPIALRFSGPILSILNPILGAGVSMASVVVDYVTAEQRAANQQRVLDGIIDALKEQNQRIEQVEIDAASAADAAEAVRTGLQIAVRNARQEKSYRIGRALGHAFAEKDANWEEVTEFIRNLEQINDADVAAIKLLWRHQRTAYKQAQRGREMSTDANDYTGSWRDVVDMAQKQTVTKDDLESRCGRLTGFGLAHPVKANPSHQRTDETCYRLTGRAVRLLALLGRNVNPAEYPKAKYHRSEPMRHVHDEDEEAALGAEWADSPAAFGR